MYIIPPTATSIIVFNILTPSILLSPKTQTNITIPLIQHFHDKVNISFISILSFTYFICTNKIAVSAITDEIAAPAAPIHFINT